MTRMTVSQLEERLYEYTDTHSKEHIEDGKRLTMILDNLKAHNDNHHGPRSQVKAAAQSGGLAAGFLGLLIIVAEIVRSLLG